MDRSLDAPYQDQEVRAFPSPEAWELWLARQHDSVSGLWLKLAKKGCATPSVSYSQALDVALCYGWIDGQKRPFDDEYWLQRFTPRRPRGKWSRMNRDRADALIAAGRMKPAGSREVERAKADGRWDAAYAGQRSATVPADLRAALDGDERAAEFFVTLDRANRYAILYRVEEAKRPETRARRIEKFVAMLRAHETVHPVPGASGRGDSSGAGTGAAGA
jgi:uncharacterized protein YdeI (YjbR/CyaY-like superfamily)